VATIGGLVIEAWGTQTNLWFYYTSERPPLWIVPAWPIATLSIDRITQLFNYLTTKVTPFVRRIASLMPKTTAARDLLSKSCETAKGPKGINFVPSLFNFKSLYWLTFLSFYVLMLFFVAPTFNKPYTILALLLCGLLILTPGDRRLAFLVFLAGTGLGYFLELWGTTRECWTYYTHQTPPLFAVLAHGMAAVAFWRTGLVLKMLGVRSGLWRPQPTQAEPEA
jgi:hypothetical protein